VAGDDRVPPPYVREADQDYITVVGAHAVLAQLGFVPVSGAPGTFRRLLRDVRDDEEKARIFAALRDVGICFSRGREWNPTELFEWFRERGLLTGSFRSIGWSGPGSFEVWDDC
jgi:hypothetical protein